MYNIYKYICNLIKINNKYIVKEIKKIINNPSINMVCTLVVGVINSTVDLQIWECKVRIKIKVNDKNLIIRERELYVVSIYK